MFFLARGEPAPIGTEVLFASVVLWLICAPMFELLKTDSNSKARLGRLKTAHGVIETPVFMPVGTQGSVKALDPRELLEMGTQIILGNTYHLNIRPGLEIIKSAG